ncbi:helicase-exonuclease AddAB subunit AddB [Jeotgalibacillus sp. R-1-5s-1]|uniref:helicase-exonuclease AddAB subunit AddB n=1 Tax=Jeotgalibacillus sp. R-1-5s-1 TaxID=2555897 RepID=UPI00106AC14B|nr:helicase-exonuclease AddAB subunit AddB [Jeotgalibacillus sp. R-1-5s-1]TFD97632.1 helicase-exonuclease AddAB subunit AddB [Jeotgalibacillus sp. R-1-5s-1]
MELIMRTGRSGTGKTDSIIRDITSRVKADPSGKPIFLIVPEQMTFQSEYRLAQETGGMVRVQVMSFTRLAWRVLQETGGAARQHINRTGTNMLVRKLISEEKDHLVMFNKAARKHGFTGHVEKMLKELRRYCVLPSELLEKTADLSAEPAPKSLVDKLKDIERIYEGYDRHLKDKYIDSEDYLQLLAQKIEQSDLIRRSTIYIDGFHSFTPQEYLVIEKLIRQSEQVTAALTVDADFKDPALFRQTTETFYTLKNIAEEMGSSFKMERFTENEKYRGSGLEFLERFFDQPLKSFEEQADLLVIESANRRAEAEAVAREIRRLARDEHYRYKDMAVLLRNGEAYHEVIEPVFKDYDIPYFIDKKRTMLNHPLIEFIRSTLEIVTKNWRYEAVFRAIKTELFYPPEANADILRGKMDRLENFVLAQGIQGDRWLNEKGFYYKRFKGLDFVHLPQTDDERMIQDELNDMRAMITEPLKQLISQLSQAKTIRGFCESLFLYLEHLQVPDKLETMSVKAEDQGDVTSAREHDQAWDAVMDLLNQFVEISGDEEMTVNEFSSVLDAGIEALEFSLVPPAIDQVIVADMELSRLPAVKASFVMGVNDGVLPARIQDDGILAEDDRLFLERAGMKLAPGVRERLSDEDFLAYRAFTSPSEKLIVSYPIADEEGKSLIVSPYIKKVTDILPDHKRKLAVNDPVEITTSEQIDYICHPVPTASFLTSQLQQLRKDYPIHDSWRETYNFYVRDHGWKEKSRTILSGLFYENRANPLSREVAKELYGSSILASVSRMERLNSCAFSHFSSHGLKLQERSIYRLEAPNIGELFHAALKWISEELLKKGVSWKTLSRKECAELAQAAVMHIGPQLQHDILNSSNKHRYIARKLQGVISQASYILSEHARAGDFEPLRVELGFGPRQELPPLHVQLDGGSEMALQGRIDRVDQARAGDRVYLRVIDYKSSVKDLDFTEIYYGLSLQMMTYLDVALENADRLVKQKAEPAGVLYFHLHNPLIKTKKPLSDEELEQEMLKKYKMKGLILGDEEVVQLMDLTLEQGNSSIISAGFKKDGKLRSDSKTASRSQFEFMRKHTRNMFKHSGNRIVTGDVSIDPYEYKKRTPCQFCSYRSVCQFDTGLEENRYRSLKPKKAEDLFSAMKEDTHDSSETR